MLNKSIIPHPPRYQPGAGIDYAEELAKSTQALALLFVCMGWFLVICAALLAITGSVLGTSTAQAGSSWWGVLLAQRGLLCSTLAIISAAIGWHFIDRAAAATRLGSVATQSIHLATKPGAELDHVAYEACVLAKTAWLEGRMNLEHLQGISQTLGGMRQFGATGLELEDRLPRPPAEDADPEEDGVGA